MMFVNRLRRRNLNCVKLDRKGKGKGRKRSLFEREYSFTHYVLLLSLAMELRQPGDIWISTRVL